MQTGIRTYASRRCGSVLMKPLPIETSHFAFDGRGPSLIRWLHHRDLLFAGTMWPDSPDGIHGAEYGIAPTIAGSPLPATSVAVVDPIECSKAWVVFDGLQVIQIVPEEVHSYWHYEPEVRGNRSGAWEVVDSEWLAAFHPRHLAGHRHFILEFDDELVEVIARELIFGHGEFSIDRVAPTDGRFAYAYLRRAQVREKAEQWKDAQADYRLYASLENNESNSSYARRCAEGLAKKVE